jgi:hypothetical protein
LRDELRKDISKPKFTFDPPISSAREIKLRTKNL